jgi:hypothetical protein
MAKRKTDKARSAAQKPPAATAVAVKPSSGNVFADLELPDAGELDRKLRLAWAINQEAKATGLSHLSEFQLLDAKAPATLGPMVNAVTRLSTFSEAQILEYISAGKIKELFPFNPASTQRIPADMVAEEDLIKASALPRAQT